MEFTVEKLVEASSSKCYDAFSRADYLSKWFTTNAVVDLRPGGQYSNDDKDDGKFLEIKPGELLRFTWDNKEHCPGTEVKVEFIPEDSTSTKIKLTHSNLASQTHVDEMKRGWTWALESVKRYLEEGKALPYAEWEKSHVK